ncbi:4-hydroxy-2-oxovalerate aldolase [Enterovibrio paralichthyis]|uniref:4-hydroxy-2-oxovalerate aldolase n=1 Tax=Enterovibrio paralichthyis TaxID=2853805 RepID=UPI001C477089|nr:4-hydroxy-2-oxovalerate aldolase [Enterovibrio paralichthyis]MBV7298626.1 4-hydroxy-2-oxovalerate aldolase [Enterovibrio paralichthyis]
MNPTILECTLRDGSYEIDFQFSKNDTLNICSALDNAGFELIEVGHGVGLGASEKNIGVALESDETYMQAAASSVSKGRWGMFAIPGIAELRHLELAKEYDMDFVRVGSTIEDFSKSEPFIRSAKQKDMMTCVNFMKSYAAAPEELARAARDAFNMGVDAVYVVDSAGGMLPNEVKLYVEAIKAEKSDAVIGFHGHNNLGLGVGNALAALEAGATIIDTSLQGFGRSAGNTTTEQMIGCLARMGLEGHIDPIHVMDIGEDLIKPMIEKRGLTSIDTVSGMSLFHSSYMPTIHEMSVKYRIDPRQLIASVCSEDIVNASLELVERHAKLIADTKSSKGAWKPSYRNYYINEQAAL